MEAQLSTKLCTTLLFLLLQVVSGCSDFRRYNSSGENINKNERVDQNKNGDANALPNNLDPKSWSEKLEGLKASAAKIANDVNQINVYLSQMFEVKNSLCARQAQLFSSCIVHAPLAPSIWRAGAACRVEQRVWDNRSFRVKIHGVNGRFQIILDNSIESSPFDAGEERTLSWSSTGTRDLRDLKLSDIGNMKIRAVDSNLPDLKNAQFTFKVDNNTLLTQEQILNSTRTNSTVLISTLPLIEYLSSADCRVGDNELDILSQEAVARATSPMPIATPEEDSKSSQDETSTLFEEWIFSAGRLQQTRMDTFLAVAQDISRLRRDLRGDLQLGCWS
ncbi:MAG: hypothetical protein RI932_1273, partial [Pseudomonadota bacterium]